MGSDFTCTTCWKGFGYPMCVACHDARRESIESRARTEGAKAERARIVAIVDAQLADLRTAHTASIREASPHWVSTLQNLIDSMTVLRGRIERGDHESGAHTKETT